MADIDDTAMELVEQLAAAEKLWELGVEVRKHAKQLESDLREFGRHRPGCPAEFNFATYPCKCGWAGVRAALDATPEDSLPEETP